MANSEPVEAPSERFRSTMDELIRKQFKRFDYKVYAVSAKGENYLGEIYKVAVKGVKLDGSDGEASFIVKVALTSAGIRKSIRIENFYKTEIYLYTKTMPTIHKLLDKWGVPKFGRFDIAKCYKGITDECEEMLVLDDLCLKGYKNVNRLKSFDYELTSKSIKNLAKYHSYVIAVKAKEPDVYNEMIKHTVVQADYGETFSAFVDKTKKLVLNICKSESYIDLLVKFLNLKSTEVITFTDEKPGSPYNILCHGDCWTNNFLFKYENGTLVDIRMLDWQLMKESTPVIDLSYMIFTGTDQELRSKHYEHLLELYYKCLSTNVKELGVDIDTYYPKKIYKDHVTKFMWYGFIWALIVLPLTLADKSDVPDILQLMDGDGNGDIACSDICRKRIKEAIEDGIKYGIIQ